MITNKQYKNHMLRLIDIILDDNIDVLNRMTKLKIEIKAIPDEEPEPISEYWSQKANEDHEPHDLGNTLHIPGEDD